MTRRFKKAISRLMLVIVSLAFVAVLGLLFMTATTPGLTLLANVISNVASSENQTISVRGISGIWRGETLINSLTLADETGQYASLENVRARWHRRKLLAWEFHSTNLSVGSIDLDRLPTASDEPGEPFALPIGFDLEKIEIANIALGEQVARRQANLSLAANLKLNPDPMSGSIRFRISPLERKADLLSGDVIFHPADEYVSIDLNLQEAAGGVVATALDLPGSPPLVISLAGSGAFSDFAFRLNSAIAGRKTFEADGTLKASENETSLQAKGKGRLGKILPPDYAALLQGDVVLDLDATRNNAGAIKIKQAKFESDGFFIAANGSYNPAGENRISGGLQAKQDALEIPDGVLGENTQAIIRNAAFVITGPANASRVEISTDLPRLSMGGMHVEGIRANLLAESFNLATRTGDFKLTAETVSGNADNEVLSKLVSSPAFAEVEGGLAGDEMLVSKIAVTSSTFAVSGKMNANIVDNTFSTSIKAELARSVLPEQASKLLRGNIDLVSTVERDQEGRIVISRLQALAPNLEAKGSATINNGEISAELGGMVQNLTAASDDLSGKLALQMRVEGTTEKPVIEAALSSDKLSFKTRELTGFSLTAKGIADMNKPDLVFGLSGAVDDVPLTGGMQLVSQSGKRLLQNLEIKNGENRVSGSLILGEDNLPEGELVLSLPDIKKLASLALQDMQGGLNGIVSFSKMDGVPHLEVKASSSQVKREALGLEDLALKIRMSDYQKALEVSGEISVGSLKQGSLAANAIRIDLATNSGWTEFSGSAETDNVPVSVSGRVRSLDGETDIELAKANAVFRGVDLALASAAGISIFDGVTRIERFPVTISGGTASISGRVSDTLDMSVELNSVNAGIVNRFVPDLDIRGAVSGNLRLTGELSDPKVDFRTVWSNAGTRQLSDFGAGPIKLTTSGTYAGDQLTLDTLAEGQDGMRAKGGGSVGLGKAGRLNLNIQGNIPFSILAAQLAANGLVLKGAANADLEITGVSNSPDIRGTVRSSKGQFIHVQSGTVVNDMQTTVTFDANTARVESLTGNLASGGRLSAQGTINLSDGFPADLNIKVTNGVYSDGEIVDAKFNADLSVTDKLALNPKLSGRIELGKTIIVVPERLPESISRLNVKHQNASESVRQQSAQLKPPNQSAGGGMRIDVLVDANNQVFIRGRGLDVELGGNLQLSGTTSAPRTTGGFSTRRGRLSILNKRLDITSANIKFAGSVIPELDITAENQSNQTTIIVRVTGPATAPEFSFSSSPALAEDEVLARLIFDRELSGLSPLQIAQLAEAAATLAGKGGSNSLLNRLQQLVNVDDLDVKTDQNTGETTVGAGRYINDSTYVGVERGQSAGSGKVRIDLNLGQGLKLRGETTGQGENKAGIFFERDY